MNFPTQEACRDYVEAELDRTVRAFPRWHAQVWTSQFPDPFEHGDAIRWKIGHDGLDGWYMLEARIDDQEFLFWFGNHQVGAEALHWFLRPAIHVAFAVLHPAQYFTIDPFTLGDVLTALVAPDVAPPRTGRFEMNTFSIT